MGIMDYIPQWGGALGNQDVSGMPTDDATAALLLKRKLAMADALRNQEAPQGQMVSGHYVAPSWTQQLAGLAGKYVAGQQEREAMQQYGQAQSEKAQKLGDLMKGKTVFETDAEGNQRETTVPYSKEELVGELSKIDTGYAPKLFENYLSNLYKEDVGQVMTPGSTFYKGGKAVYTAPALPKERNQPSAVEEYQFAQGQGYKGSFEDWKKAQKSEGVTVNYGAPVSGIDANGNPVFFQPSKTGGNPQIIPGVKPADTGAKPTEFQSKAKLYFNSMSTASKTLNDLEGSGKQITPGYGETMIDESTGPGKVAISRIRSEERKSYVQAQKQWIDSINRVRSGANLPEIEYNRAVATFFPQLNDSPAQIKQKQLARQQEETSMLEAAGKAGQGQQPQLNQPNQPASPAGVDYFSTYGLTPKTPKKGL